MLEDPIAIAIAARPAATLKNDFLSMMTPRDLNTIRTLLNHRPLVVYDSAGSHQVPGLPRAIPIRNLGMQLSLGGTLATYATRGAQWAKLLE